MGEQALTNRIVLITGASSGIGRAAALAFADAGAWVAVTARREDRLLTLADEIERRGVPAMAIAADLSEAGAIDRIVTRVQQTLGPIDILVNNAGFGRTGLTDELDLASYRAMIEVNFLAAVALTKAVLPAMRMRKRGHIINISSVIGTRALPLSGAYCASKFALNGFTEALRVEAAPDRIAVSLIQPGLTATEFAEVSQRGTRFAGRRPLRQRFAHTPERVAAVIVACARQPRRQVSLTLPGKALLAADLVAPWLVDRLLRLWARRDLRVPASIRVLPDGERARRPRNPR